METLSTKLKLTVVKIGGNVIDDEQELDQFVSSFAALEGAKILVHGGGKLATQLAARLDIPQHMIEGRRVTDEATLRIVTMVYAGYINKQITAKLQASGCNAMGLCGTDANLIKAHKRQSETMDYGFAGDVDVVNAALIQSLLKAGLSPVVAPITHDGKGQLLNTNADTIAREIAVSMSPVYEVRLVYCFEKEGVLRDVINDVSVIPVITAGEVEQLKKDAVITGGMLPKIHNAIAALSGGVKEIIIGKSDRLPQLVQGLSGTKMIHE
jgi:acetylglutamate kinase